MSLFKIGDLVTPSNNSHPRYGKNGLIVNQLTSIIAGEPPEYIVEFDNRPFSMYRCRVKERDLILASLTFKTQNNQTYNPISDEIVENTSTKTETSYQCECGKEKHGFASHTTWCDMHDDNVMKRASNFFTELSNISGSTIVRQK